MAERRAALLGWACLLLAVLLASLALAQQVPPGRWWPLLAWPSPDDMAQIVAAKSLLPRLAVSVLAGAALGLSGGLLQAVLRNPVASPGTLGISAGAQLALAVASLYAPAWLAGLGRDAVALAGGAGAAGLVLALAWRSRLAPGTVLLCGLVVGLYAGSLGGTLVLLHTRQLAGLFLWGAGSLVQLGWDVTAQLGVRLAVAGVAAALLARPLRLLDLPDDVARSLGAPVPLLRLAGLGIAVALASAVVSLVGVIGFVGLAAPAMVRLADGRPGLMRCTLVGAALLALTDQVVQLAASHTGAPLPTGAVTALLGAPVLLWLLTRLTQDGGSGADIAPRRAARPDVVLLGAAVLLAAVLIGATGLGNSLHGWRWDLTPMPLRLPRVAGAGLAGAMLAVAGLLLQRLLNNPIASPDVLGIGTGTMLGLAVALWLGVDGPLPRLLAGMAGGAAALAIILAFARGGTVPLRMLLAGLALGAAVEALLTLLLASGDPRAETVLAWMAGSTYLVDGALAWSAALAMAVLLGVAVLTLRWLVLLPLGTEAAQALGVPVSGARVALLLLAAALTGSATLLVGPLSFVGLMAPHLGRLLGLSRVGPQMAAAALFGATVMVCADWAGRTVLFPAEIPAGVVAALLGGPVLLLALTRQQHA